MEFRDQTLEDQDIELDGNAFSGCTFRRCRFIFRGGTVVMGVCRIEDCRWWLSGPAAQTIRFLSEMYRYVEGGREMVEEYFHRIRQGI